MKKVKRVFNLILISPPKIPPPKKRMQTSQYYYCPPLNDPPPAYHKLADFAPVYVATIGKKVDSGFLSIYPPGIVNLDISEKTWRTFIRQINEKAQYVPHRDGASASFRCVRNYIVSRNADKDIRKTKIKEIENVLSHWNDLFFHDLGVQVTLIKCSNSLDQPRDNGRISSYGKLKFYLRIDAL
ncbi:hypothetical protein BGW37DRAFT_256066 [Umbelopsis sp. PMI_123]|nr:hypothetical protein BGW37DRAFT_256066 [Umbelopsis sp. PMI_123]